MIFPQHFRSDNFSALILNLRGSNFWLHIALGLAIVVLSLIMIAVPKGTKTHRKIGKIYTFVGILVCVSAAIGCFFIFLFPNIITMSPGMKALNISSISVTILTSLNLANGISAIRRIERGILQENGKLLFWNIFGLIVCIFLAIHLFVEGWNFLGITKVCQIIGHFLILSVAALTCRKLNEPKKLILIRASHSLNFFTSSSLFIRAFLVGGGRLVAHLGYSPFVLGATSLTLTLLVLALQFIAAINVYQKIKY